MQKILIVSLKAGAGHLKAAQAIEESFSETHDFSVRNIDLLDYSSSLLKLVYGKMYLNAVKALPELYSYNYKHYESAKNFVKPRLLLDKINVADFFKVLDEFSPDVVVATHFIPTAILDNYRRKEGKNFKLAVVLTDYEFHPLWLVDGADLFCTATDDVKAGLVFYGVDAEKVAVTGIPIGRKFSATRDKAALREKHGLASDRPVVLISAGSFGLTSPAEALDNLSGIKNDFQVVVVCGHNEKLKAQLEETSTREPRLTRVFGYVDCMDELMAASDVLITKPGGITVSEALAIGLPMLLIEPIPGQEEANADYLLEQGVAVKARNLASLVYKLQFLLENKETLANMSERAKHIAKPEAAKVVVGEVIKMLAS